MGRPRDGGDGVPRPADQGGRRQSRRRRGTGRVPAGGGRPYGGRPGGGRADAPGGLERRALRRRRPAGPGAPEGAGVLPEGARPGGPGADGEVEGVPESPPHGRGHLGGTLLTVRGGPPPDTEGYRAFATWAGLPD